MPTTGGASCAAEMAGDMGKCATSEPALLTRSRGDELAGRNALRDRVACSEVFMAARSTAIAGLYVNTSGSQRLLRCNSDLLLGPFDLEHHADEVGQ